MAGMASERAVAAQEARNGAQGCADTPASAAGRTAGLRPCVSCEGFLDGTEPGAVCSQCIRDWATWHRNERESERRWVRLMMGGER